MAFVEAPARFAGGEPRSPAVARRPAPKAGPPTIMKRVPSGGWVLQEVDGRAGVAGPWMDAPHAERRRLPIEIGQHVEHRGGEPPRNGRIRPADTS
jgi:hypothetical protein